MPRGRPKKNKTEPFKLVDELTDEPKVQNETLDDTLENNTEPTETTKLNVETAKR